MTSPSHPRARRAVVLLPALIVGASVLTLDGPAVDAEVATTTNVTLAPDPGIVTTTSLCVATDLTITCPTTTTAPTTATTTTGSTTTTGPDELSASTTTTTRPEATSAGPDPALARTEHGPIGADRADARTAGSGGVGAPQGPSLDLGSELVGPDDLGRPAWGSLEAFAPRGPRSTRDLLAALGDDAATTAIARMLAPFPVAGLAFYTDDFGAFRHGPPPHPHAGTDIFAPSGTPVVASLDGTVGRMSRTTPLGGTSLRITSADGTFVYYAHLVDFAPGLANGQSVRVGDVVGYVGNTGNARMTPPHLHFEIHPLGGAAVSPALFLDRWLEEATRRLVALGIASPAARATSTASPGSLRPSQSRAATPSILATGAPLERPRLDERRIASEHRAARSLQPVLLALAGGAVWWWITRPPVRRRAPAPVSHRS